MAEQQPTEHDLEHRQRRDARQREAPSAAGLYEAIRSEAESERTRPLPGLWFAALAAGLSMGFSMVAQALLYTDTPDAAWRPIAASCGYSIGFMFVILGRQQRFTQNTLTPVPKMLRVRSLAVFTRTHKLWAVVLLDNIVGTAVFAGSHGLGAFFGALFVPTLPGNLAGGIMRVALVNDAQVAYSNAERNDIDLDHGD